jgi:hypothetical protein
MTDVDPIHPIGAEWRNELEDKTVEITDIELTYVLEVAKDGEETATGRDKELRYPEESLRRMVAQDEYTPVDAEETEDDDEDKVECKHCDRLFGSEHSMKIHNTRVHVEGHEDED